MQTSRLPLAETVHKITWERRERRTTVQRWRFDLKKKHIEKKKSSARTSDTAVAARFAAASRAATNVAIRAVVTVIPYLWCLVVYVEIELTFGDS